MKNSLFLLEYDSSEQRLSKKELDLIRKLNKKLFVNSDGEKGLFNLISQDRIKAKQYVGIFRVGDLTIEVLPKIFKVKDKDLTENENSDIRKNLLYMLSYVKKLSIHETDIANLNKIDSLFEVIVYLFAKNLLSLLKKDLNRSYVRVRNNENFLKGKLLLKEQIKYNYINKAKFYCEYDEFLDNNLLNQIFKSTITNLLKFTKNNETSKLLSSCNFILQDITLRKIYFHECNVKFNRLNVMYEDSFNLAKLLLFGNSTNLSSSDIDSFSLMFDMNKLFEEFIGEFIKRNFGDKFEVKTQKSSEFVFKEKINQNFSKFQLKPDIYLKDKETDNILIIDTKYKKLNKSDNNYGVSQSDIYQMVMYGLRYFDKETSYNSDIKLDYSLKKRVILLYPEYNDLKISDEIVLKTKENIDIEIKTINLHNNLIDNNNNNNCNDDKYDLKCQIMDILKPK